MDNEELIILREKIKIYEKALYEIKEVAEPEDEIFAIVYVALNYDFE